MRGYCAHVTAYLLVSVLFSHKYVYYILSLIKSYHSNK
ncbi:hypothetical protein PTRA_a0637 [Pseudoalteromonas translucida KMM 520]|uniref:Uncharacterized protein n=1 Tax=Pseudoalteromonas translucida KMM 520 TaxID=1315283 RepID=A0A0U2MMQ5_9GAMM|nr:hypothetical protein PTRA_a0637 [Pseudoalteromonas translucida KMM 520]